MAPTTHRKAPPASAACHAGLSGMALYLPPYRVDLQQWCEWTGSEWQKIRKVVGSGFRLLGPQHSVYTMAANALLRLIRQYDVDPARIRYLALGTESSTDNSAGAIIVKGMVDDALRGLGLPPIARNCEVPEFKHACLAGIYAMKSAVRFLNNDGEDGVAIVVCTDKALYERGSSGEPTQGAGAVAMLLEPQPRLAAINLRHAGTASEYRGIDFRKPLTGRLNGHAHCLDIPVYNGR
ncbi:MAG: hydroxymethylglutaryl-CoA synthase, partial [Gammaproteobacteria bacterium]|nr:hydroxymethylglutaryl-CoA synthase [Gammaproteobacteria bacterium]